MASDGIRKECEIRNRIGQIIDKITAKMEKTRLKIGKIEYIYRKGKVRSIMEKMHKKTYTSYDNLYCSYSCSLCKENII